MSREDDEKFEKVRLLLSAYNCDYIVIYRAVETESGVDLKRHKIATMKEDSPEGLDKIGELYQELAMLSFKGKKDMVLSENVVTKDLKGRPIPRTVVLNRRPTPPNPPPTNSLCQRWWHLIVGSGVTRKAGYVIVARLPAKGAKDLDIHAVKIQEIMQSV